MTGILVGQQGRRKADAFPPKLMCEVRQIRYIRWTWLLPVIQLALASTALVYGPHEYRTKARLDGISGDNNVFEYMAQHLPAPVERVSKGMNFPALTLAYPLRKYDSAIYSHNNNYTLIWISPREIAFFIGIVFFWYYVGRMLDQRLARTAQSRWSKKTRFVEVTFGIVFGILTGAYALKMTASSLFPERQIGAFGIAWSIALIAYFAWRFTREFRQGA